MNVLLESKVYGELGIINSSFSVIFKSFIMEEIIWRPVVGFEGLYEVSNTGLVRSLNYNRTGVPGLLHPEVKRCKGSLPYLKVVVHKDKKQMHRLVHRLVAEAFIPNPLGLPQVNHKDCDVQNNRVENLEWCDARYNTTYGDAKKKMIETKRRTGNWGSEKVVQKMKERGYVRRVRVIYPDGREVICETQKEAAEILGVKRCGGICGCLKGLYKTIKGCRFEFV